MSKNQSINGFCKSFLFLSISFISFNLFAQSFTLLSWNIRDFGQTKDETEIKAIAKIVKDYDIIALQEVVSGYGGSQAVARLADQLNRMGNKWDYRISNPTRIPPYTTERYAFIWKPNKVMMIGRPFLEKSLESKVDREPFIGKFRIEGKEFFILNFHSRPHSKHPEEELIHFPEVLREYSSNPLIIAGDFNLKENHEIFQPWYRLGYEPSIRNQPTTLKRKCPKVGKAHLNHSIDNIYYPTTFFHLQKAQAIDFVKSCENLEWARKLTDHLPVVGWYEFRD